MTMKQNLIQQVEVGPLTNDTIALVHVIQIDTGTVDFHCLLLLLTVVGR